jgi:uncharacterized membrane protein
MGMSIRPSRAVFAAVMIGLGIIGLIYGNSALIWEPIPKTLPGRPATIYLCGVIELGTGIGLLLRPSVVLACRVLLPFLLLWLALLKLPGLLLAPQVMQSWEAFAEVAATSAGGWCLFAAHAGAWEQRHLEFAVGESGIRAARLLLIAALPMIGLSHFVYQDLTASLVPKWMHFPSGWTYLTGAGSLAAAAGMLFGIYPRLAANLEAAMLWIITVLVWVPRVAFLPADQENWTEFFISCAIAAGAWLVADTYRSVPWLASGQAARAVSLDRGFGAFGASKSAPRSPSAG